MGYLYVFLLLAGREYVSICKNCALCDNFLKLCMVLGMDITFSKTTAHKLGRPLVAVMQKNPRWPSLETEKAISPLLLALQPCVIPVYLFFFGLRNTFLKSFISFNYIFRVILSFDMVIFL